MKININKKITIVITYLTLSASSIFAQSSIFNTAAPQRQTGGALPKIAVYVSEHSGYSQDEKSTMRLTATNTILRSGLYQVVDRSTRVIEEELARQASGAIDDDQITRFGRQAGAQYICVLDKTFLRNRREPVYCVDPNTARRRVCNHNHHQDHQISARIIDVETAEVLAIGVIEADIQSGPMLTDAVNNAVSNMLEKVHTASAADLPKMAVYVTGGETRRQRNYEDENVRQDNALYSWVLEALFMRARANRNFKVVERSEAFTLQIDREQTAQRSGAVDDSQIARLGRQYGVQYVLIVNTDWVGGTYNIIGRVVNVETATVEATSSPQHTDDTFARLQSIAVNTVEEMISRETTAAEQRAERDAERRRLEEQRAEERRLSRMEARARGAAWIGMLTVGAGASVLQNDFLSTTDPDALSYQVFHDQTSGFNMHFGVEVFQRRTRFFRFGLEYDLGWLGVDKEPIRENYSPIEDDSTSIGGGTFWRIGAYVKLTTLDYLYAKAAAGRVERSGYNFEVQGANRWTTETIRGGTVWGYAYSLGGGINIPFQTANMKRRDDVFSMLAIFAEANYHMVPLSGGTSEYMTYQAGLRWGGRISSAR